MVTKSGRIICDKCGCFVKMDEWDTGIIEKKPGFSDYHRGECPERGAAKLARLDRVILDFCRMKASAKGKINDHLWAEFNVSIVSEPVVSVPPPSSSAPDTVHVGCSTCIFLSQPGCVEPCPTCLDANDVVGKYSKWKGRK